MVNNPSKDVVGEAPEVDPSKFSESDVAAIADRLERDDYANAFESLNDWHILRALAFKGSELADPYRHLLDVESFDEC
ncbi:MAG: DUF2555 domain-containing protein [Pseudanabaena sp.]|jgi:hypothetical protein|nr:DUF2555 domain-containing protein [Pseudanabaena sp. M090S1SP2A07QC]MCA6506597.1 DUF2555 domain-containing protein [Pseudanabaena sp. M172S2SP2A07QC]MCA6522815.1 DUF2555 domain-containing protein [Pseudanabaena sp. M051S1SP2A07QC]MCA6531892.1 DUF2555 domain-containing protein [Pseudanabaena sp. M125S2SP2A07QC]MCA6536076.1 DUF2555 domain-containing protein [Pseudanabaena sp. M176S2SP2A07QC]MCA6541246.1 DUF2555 domain-containing protein [Pseudanabaena sp. M037S2SP2A07QC]MCA6544688.1 DUF2555 